MIPDFRTQDLIHGVALSKKLRNIEAAERAALQEQIALTKAASVLEKKDLDSGCAREVLMVVDALTGEVMEIEM